MRSLAAFVLLLTVAFPRHAIAQLPDFDLTVQASGTAALLQAVSVVDAQTVWISGHDGVVLRTTDGGVTWSRVSTPALDSLQYRDVHAFSAQSATILSAGTGPQSRIYTTEDGGASWDLAYLMNAEDGFLDCMDFWDHRGFAYGDAIDGVPFILVTSDSGRTWRRPDRASLPASLDGEGGFAASGTCARAGRGGMGWIATGANGAARILSTSDYGQSWAATDVPVVRGEMAGLFTVDFVGDGDTGVAFGGDLAVMNGPTKNAARTTNRGVTWEPASPPPLAGPVYGSAVAANQQVIVVVGPGGADISGDAGLTWASVDRRAYWAVGFGGGEVAWLTGPEGRIVRLSIP